MNSTLLFAAVLVPVLGAVVLPVLGHQSERVRNLFALLLVLVSLGASVALLPAVLGGEQVFAGGIHLLGPTIFHADPLAVFMALVSTIVGLSLIHI